jgi:CRP-like cAMP-binding protein
MRTLGARHIIFEAGQPAAHLYLVQSGHAIFYRLTPDGKRVLLARLASGDVFGLGTLIAGPVHYIGTAETTRESELLVWERLRVRQLAQQYPRLAENALGIILRYLAAHADRLVDLMSCNAAQRLARVVLHLGEQSGRIAPTGVEIEATNEELSELANLSTFTTSRLLNRWARDGAVAKSRGKLFIRTPEKLLVE